MPRCCVILSARFVENRPSIESSALGAKWGSGRVTGYPAVTCEETASSWRQIAPGDNNVGFRLIDTPGLREVQLWATDPAVAQTFPEVSELAIDCRFRDCHHQGEPGCAAVAGVGSGQIDADRLESFPRLRRELDRLDRESDPLLAKQHKSKIKRIMRAQEQQQRRRTKP
jgi:hypothetical protein